MSTTTTTRATHHKTTTPFTIYEDTHPVDESIHEHRNSTPMDGSLDPDMPINSIEDEPIFSSTQTGPRRISTYTTHSSISEFPLSEPGLPEDDHGYAPPKSRPPFRNPSSVRAIQMSSPPPFEPYSSPRSQKPYKMTSSSLSRSGTPRSLRSQSTQHGSGLDSTPATTQRPGSQAQQQTQTKQRLPLVLLHVTILPLSLPYSATALSAVLPEWLGNDFRLIEGKLADVVLMSRGILIPHPRDEYDLLEERLLESLDLFVPRLKCGHFQSSSDDYDSNEDHNEDTDIRRESFVACGNEMILVDGDDVDDDASTVCADCNRSGRYSSSGRKRWDIKIYAANGLMREGAWNAAWCEMERIDVEITPWIPDDIKRALEKQMEKEELEEVQRRQAAEEKARHEAEEQIKLEQMRIADKERERHESEKRKLQSTAMPSMITHEVLSSLDASSTERRPSAVNLEKPGKLQHSSRASSRPRTPKDQSIDEIPVATLLRNYFYLLACDRRNILIVILTAFLFYLTIGSRPSNQALQFHNLSIPDTISPQVFQQSSAEIIVTTTEVATATTTATATVTAVRTTTATEISVATVTETMEISLSEYPASPVPETPDLPKSHVVESPTKEDGPETPNPDADSYSLSTVGEEEVLSPQILPSAVSSTDTLIDSSRITKEDLLEAIPNLSLDTPNETPNDHIESPAEVASEVHVEPLPEAPTEVRTEFFKRPQCRVNQRANRELDTRSPTI